MTRPQPKGGAGRVSPDSNPNRRRTIFLGVDGNGHFAPALDPTAFIVTAASDGAAAGGELGGASAHLVPPAPPVIELSNEMKAAFVRDGYLILPGAPLPAPSPSSSPLPSPSPSPSPSLSP